MTSRQRVLRCLEFDHPDHAPRDLWMLPIAVHDHGVAAIDDFKARWPVDIGHPTVRGPRGRLVAGDPYAIGQYRDEWGCVWKQIKAGIVGEIKAPILDDWSKLGDVRPPTEMLDVNVEAVNAACAASDSFLLANCCPRPFERMQFLRGSENLYMDLAEESSEVLELLHIVSDFYRKEMELWAATKVDALVFMDDWGSQRALLINPAQWRKLFKPLYAQYAAIAHGSGKKLFMHSDGHIAEIYPDLIEIGVDAVNSQLFCMDIEELGRRFKGRITFWGEMDRQNLLPYGTDAQVRAAASRVIENLWSPAGGFIAQFELSAGSKLTNAQAVFETWRDLTGTKIKPPGPI